MITAPLEQESNCCCYAGLPRNRSLAASMCRELHTLFPLPAKQADFHPETTNRARRLGPLPTTLRNLNLAVLTVYRNLGTRNYYSSLMIASIKLWRASLDKHIVHSSKSSTIHCSAGQYHQSRGNERSCAYISLPSYQLSNKVSFTNSKTPTAPAYC